MMSANAEADTHGPIFSARITPHRSLSRNGFVAVMATVCAISFVGGSVFYMMGAWPVIGFFGLDAALVWWAFRANYRSGRACEWIEVTGSEILVRRLGADGRCAEWRLNPYWARLVVERDEDHVTGLTLASHGKRCEIARWLSPLEKADFAKALSDALLTARRGPAVAG